MTDNRSISNRQSAISGSSNVQTRNTDSEERHRHRDHRERSRKAGTGVEGAGGEKPGGGRRRKHHQAPHQAESAAAHQGGAGRAGSGAARVQRAGALPRVRETDPPRPENPRRRAQSPLLPEVRGSGRQMSRLKDRYEKEVAPALKNEFGYKNVMAIPKIEKIVVNMGLGEATQNAKIVDTGADEVARITGQKPVTTRAKKSIAQFKVRKGMPIGAMVTLRGERMWDFLDRLMAVALPRVRDFRGVSPKGFDGRGNYTLGLKDQLLFPEIDYMKVDKARGMNISVVTTARTDEESRKLLQLLGMPFRAS